MNAFNLKFRGLCLMAFVMVLLSSCKSNSSEAQKLSANQELATTIAKYVTCPIDSVKMMLASSDTVIQMLETCSLESLSLGNEEINTHFASMYGKEIPTILKLYGTYDVVTNFETSEANAAFAWHEIANALIAEHYGKEKVDTAEVETLFKVIDEIMEYYSGGTQSDMNISAWREVMLSDYRLISAYKTLYDNCNKPSLLKSVHDSYKNLLEMYRNRCEQIDGHWSDLPRELACMQMDMMDERRESIMKLNSQYMRGKLTVRFVKAKLDKRPKDADWDLGEYLSDH